MWSDVGVAEQLTPMPEDWSRALAVVAHPDDMEYGAASAVARWTDQGKDVRYLLVTRGEAGISTIPPSEVGPSREEEQRRSCLTVGVSAVEFLDRSDGLVEADLALRRDLAGAIRRHQPEVILSINYRDSWGGPSWNHADHRAVGRALLDSVRDAANPWIFPDSTPVWPGVRFAAFNGSPQATHGVDVTGYLERGIESLRCHALYLANLGGDMSDPAAFLRSAAESTGALLGVQHAVAFELVTF
jgi:LmbE family N-acetylglucosaminyl deacetylase